MELNETKINQLIKKTEKSQSQINKDVKSIKYQC